MLDLSSFNNLQLDAIKEVGNIGTGNAATALSNLLSCMIDMDVPKADLVSIYSISEYYDEAPDTPVAAVFVRSFGEFGCSLIFIQDEEASNLMVNLLLKQQFGDYLPEELSQEMHNSAIAEVGNIILSSFLNSISMLIGTRHQISPPGVTHDMLASVLDVVGTIFGQIGDMAVLVSTELRIEGESIGGQKVSGHIVMLPDPDALELLLRKLQVL